MVIFIQWYVLLMVAYPSSGFFVQRVRFLSSVSSSASRVPQVATEKKSHPATNPIDGSYDFDFWKKAFMSQPQEFDYIVPSSDIEGVIPPELFGSLFRNRPALFERGEHKYGHYLDGDGQVTRMTFAGDGVVHFTSKFVRTEEYVAETEADAVLFRGTFRTQPKSLPNQPFSETICLKNAFNLRLKNPANTNVVMWGDRLLAFFEAGLPHRLDPRTLDTLGTDDMNIGLKSGLPLFMEKLHDLAPAVHDMLFGQFASAHPKVDPVSGRLVSWVYSAVEGTKGPLHTHPLMKIYEWDARFQPVAAAARDGTVTTAVTHLLPNTAIAPHDFSLTENYYVFVENRASGDTLPYLLGTKNPAQCMDLEPANPMMLHLVPRLGKDLPPIVLPLTPGFTIHSVCAFERAADAEGRRLLELYSTAWESQSVAEGKVRGGLLGSWEGAAPNFDDIPLTLLYKTAVQLDGLGGGRLVSHAPVDTMERIVIEHPHANPAYESLEARYLYMSLGSVTGISSPPVGYQRVDLATGEKQQWFAPLHTYCEEVVVVPKETTATTGRDTHSKDKDKDNDHDSDSDGSNKEDAVWVLASMFDAVRERACVGVFDGERMQDGPVATVWLHHALPHSLHGSFVSRTFLD